MKSSHRITGTLYRKASAITLLVVLLTFASVFLLILLRAAPNTVRSLDSRLSLRAETIDQNTILDDIIGAMEIRELVDCSISFCTN